MDEKALVESQVADAIELIKKLDAITIAPTLAVWYFYDDVAQWKLLFAGQFFDDLLPNQESVAYRKVVEAMAGTSPSSLTVSDVKLVGSQSPLPRAIRTLIRTPADGIVRAHFTDIMLNGIFIKEMIILRSV